MMAYIIYIIIIIYIIFTYPWSSRKRTGEPVNQHDLLTPCYQMCSNAGGGPLLLVLTGEGLAHTGSRGDVRTSGQNENKRYAALTRVTPSFPFRLTVHQVFSKSLILQSFVETTNKLCDRQITRACSEGCQNQRCKHKTLSPHFQVHTKQEVSGVCMLWLIHQVVKNQEVRVPFLIVS